MPDDGVPVSEEDIVTDKTEAHPEAEERHRKPTRQVPEVCRECGRGPQDDPKSPGFTMILNCPAPLTRNLQWKTCVATLGASEADGGREGWPRWRWCPNTRWFTIENGVRVRVPRPPVKR